MDREHPRLNDLAQLLTGIAGLAKGVEQEVEEVLRRRFEAWLGDVHPVSREEHEVVMEMARLAREDAIGLRKEISDLRRRVEKLESDGKDGEK